MVVGVRQAWLGVLETADLLGISHTPVTQVHKEMSAKFKISRKQQLCGSQCLDNVRGQERTAWRERQRLLKKPLAAKANSLTSVQLDEKITAKSW